MSASRYGHALKVYEELDSHATMEEQHGCRVFRGSKVASFRAVGMSQAYYSPIFTVLEQMKCIERLEHRPGAPSVIGLHGAPDPEEFERKYKEYLTRPRQPSKIEQRVSNLEGRLGEIDLAAVLVNYEQRITRLEADLLNRREV